MANEVTITSTIWEECVDERICIKIPIIGRKCVHIKACVRLIRERGTIFVEVEAFGRRWRYTLTNACHTVFEWGIGRLRLCVQSMSGGVRIVLQGCIGVDGVKKCWTLVAQDIRFFALNDLSAEEFAALGYEEPSLAIASSSIADEVGTIASPLSEAETAEVLQQRG